MQSVFLKPLTCIFQHVFDEDHTPVGGDKVVFDCVFLTNGNSMYDPVGLKLMDREAKNRVSEYFRHTGGTAGVREGL